MYASSRFSDYNLPYKNISEFLDEEISKEDPLVLGYSFTGKPFKFFLEDLRDGRDLLEQQIVGPTSFPTNNVWLYPIEKNYLDNIQSKYYNPTDFEDDFDYEQTHGKNDLVRALYSDQTLDPLDGDLDPYNVLSKDPDESEQTNEEIYAESIAEFIDYDDIDPTQEIKLILPEGAKVV